MPVSVAHQGDVAIVLIDNPPVNAASHAVRAGLVAAIAAVNDDPQAASIVLACSGATFVAGADIRELGAPAKPPFLTDVALAIEESAKPVVAALHGTALGGGFELALAAHARIAEPSAQFGLPEVKLGIVPGAGGTQRLPRLAGMAKAIEIASTGRRVPASEGLALGIIDRLADGDLIAASVAYARELAGQEPRRTGRLAVPAFDDAVIAAQIAAVREKARGQDAPEAAARAVRMAADLPLGEGLARERSRFLELVASDQASALRYVFAAERQAGRAPGLEGTTPRRVETVGIVGAGLMGAGIAVAFANAGFRVRAVERDQPSADSGLGRVEALYGRMVKSGRISEAEKALRLNRVQLFTDRTAVSDCDLVIEAVFDDLSVKQELFASLSSIVRPDAVLATNTSYLDPNAIAAVVDDPSRFLGLHFFSPANIMRLLEVVRTDAVAPDVLATGLAVAKRLGKVAVVSGVCEGFIGNRIFTAYRRECDRMLEEGALPHQIDAALEAFGFPMGPYAVNDLAGLDISWARRKRHATTQHAAHRYALIADRLCEAGRFGQKAGKGYYGYETGRKEVNAQVTALVEAVSREKGIVRRTFDADEIVSKVMAAITEEGQAILAEGIASRASDIDLVMINGYGYPAWRGGPMFQAGLEAKT
jgi:3-hydroxyacyl-CoA dehydrogenase